MAMEQRRARGRNVDRLSILDISLEDDTLLPLVAEESEASKSLQQPVQDSACLVQENKPLADSSTSNQAPAASKELRKSKTRSSLRRSLAWDKAFLTGEGVLDLDELPISVRSSPKRLPELPHFDVGTKAPSGSGQVNSVTTTAGAEPSLPSWSKDDAVAAAAAAKDLSKITSGPRCQSERFDATRWKDSGFLSGQGVQKPAPEKSDAVPTLMPPIPRPVPAKKLIESAIQKGTRLRLPSSLPRPEDKRNAVPLGTEKERTSSLTKKVSSVSRRVKDTLGKVLPGRSAVRSSVSAGEPTSPASTGRSSVSSSRSSLHSVDGIEGCSSAESSVHNEEAGSVGGEEASSKEGSRYYLRSSTTGSRLNPLAKPTGLKVPSPKLGFFDPGQVLPAPQPPKPGGHAVRIANPLQQKTKAYGIPKAKPVPESAHYQLRSSVSASAPSTPRKLNCDVLSPRGRPAIGSDAATTPRGKVPAVRGSSKSARKLGLDGSSTCPAPTSCCSTGDNAEIQQQGELQQQVVIHERPAEVDAAAELRSRDENAPARPPSPAAATVRCPLADNHEILNAAAEPEQQKEKNSFFAFAKRTVQRLSSSPLQENTDGQENRIPRKSKKTWTLGLPEAAAATLEGQFCSADSKEGSFVRTAPVQHSPPHKMAPEPSPWSPVKRNAGQLGPFDCTKTNARVEDDGWEVL